MVIGYLSSSTIRPDCFSIIAPSCTSGLVVWHRPGALSLMVMLLILLLVNVGLLDLAHDGTFSGTPHVNTTRRCEGKEQAEHEACPAEPQKCGDRLRFSAST